MNRYYSRHNEVNTIYNIIRKRAFKVICIGAVIMITLIVGIYNSTNTTHASNNKEKRVISIEVKSGATLWSIANEYADYDMYKDNKEYVDSYVKENIPSVKVIKGDATYLMWMDVRDICADSVRLCEYIRQTTGLYISNGRQFGKAGEGFVRINVACPREIVKLGMEKFKEAVILFNGTKGKC